MELGDGEVLTVGGNLGNWMNVFEGKELSIWFEN